MSRKIEIFPFIALILLFCHAPSEGQETSSAEHDSAKRLIDRGPEFASLIKEARRSLDANDFSSARSNALNAIKVSSDQAQSREANDLSTKINNVEQTIHSLDTAVNRARWNEAQRSWSALKDLHPKNVLLAGYEPIIKIGLSKQGQEQVGVSYFYNGDYKEAAESLQKLIDANQASARVYFYLGCSYAALGLIEENDAARSYLQKAHTQFAMARKMEPGMKVDTKFISPRILEVYRTKEQ